MVLGLIPGAITAALLTGVFVAIALWARTWASDIASAITGDDTPNALLVALFAIAIIGGGVVLAVYTFTTITLLIGQPFFERISDIVSDTEGLTPVREADPWWRGTLRGIRDGLRLLLWGAAMGTGAFVVGLIPVVGTAAGFAVNVLFGGYLLALELTAYPLTRAGVVRLRARRAALAARRSRALGFGVAAYVVCLIPLGAVASMPALVAGGTLLARHCLTDSARPATA